jgi:hypothetical protein
VRRGPARRGPVAGWQSAVLIALRSGIPAGRRGRHWRWLLWPGLVAAGVAGFWLWRGRPHDADLLAPDLLAIDVTIHPGAASMRGRPQAAGEIGSRRATVGDRLVVSASAKAANHVEIRVYRDGVGLVLRCPGQDVGCRIDSDQVQVAVDLGAPGRYESLVTTSERPLPSPPAVTSADLDTDALIAGGAQVRLGPPVVVW